MDQHSKKNNQRKKTDFSKKAAIFAEGHLMQIEVAAITAQTSKKKLAKSFMTFLISDKAQSIIPTTNWMYPAKNPKLALPEAFDIKVAKDKVNKKERTFCNLIWLILQVEDHTN